MNEDLKAVNERLLKRCARLKLERDAAVSELDAANNKHETQVVALERIAAGNPAPPGEWLSDIEMADIARAALK